MVDKKELLKAGVQFGHESKRWNPKMKKNIFGEKNGIHLINIEKTVEGIEKAAEFLKKAAAEGPVLIVGTKKQASQIVQDTAVKVGAYYINQRWAGGLFTNFKVVKLSLNKLAAIEKGFEEGIEGRTKYEVSRLKKEWDRLNRLYSGIKNLTDKPKALIVVDANFEKSAIREANKIGIPVVAIVDTNSDPDNVDYVIPANDDALNSITTILNVLGDAILEGNKGNGIKHNLKDYSKVEVKITKVLEPTTEQVATESPVVINSTEKAAEAEKAVDNKKPRATRSKEKGILEKVKEQAESKTKKPAAKKKTVAKKESK